jgi:hypothetical protein
VGVLVAKAYPTRLALGLADHTYVECGTGARGWSCFGGKQGGRVLRSRAASTRQADAIATADEHSGLKCYLINGVCHQAANRILYAAGFTVEGARGYGVSQAMFGVYGRVGIFPCSSPFERHEGVSGDLPACAGFDVAHDDRPLPSDDQADAAYIESVVRIYDRHAELFRPGDAQPRAAVKAFHLELFANMVEFKVGNRVDDGLRDRLLAVRGRIEDGLLDVDRRHAQERLDGADLAAEVDALALALQAGVAAETSDDQYQALFGLEKGEVVRVADPDIVARS